MYRYNVELEDLRLNTWMSDSEDILPGEHPSVIMDTTNRGQMVFTVEAKTAAGARNKVLTTLQKMIQERLDAGG